MKKIIPYLLIGYFVLQLAIPAYFVYQHYNTLYNGESYKVEVVPYDPYDPFRGRYVALRTELPHSDGKGAYAVLEKNAQGYAVITKWTAQRPEKEQYAKNLQLDRYYMNEKLAPKAENLQNTLDWEENTMYLIVNVRKGHYVIRGLYINDVPIEQYIGQVQEDSFSKQ